MFTYIYLLFRVMFQAGSWTMIIIISRSLHRSIFDWEILLYKNLLKGRTNIEWNRKCILGTRIGPLPNRHCFNPRRIEGFVNNAVGESVGATGEWVGFNNRWEPRTADFITADDLVVASVECWESEWSYSTRQHAILNQRALRRPRSVNNCRNSASHSNTDLD